MYVCIYIMYLSCIYHVHIYIYIYIMYISCINHVYIYIYSMYIRYIFRERAGELQFFGLAQS